MKFSNILKRGLPVILLFLIVSILFGINFKPGTVLSGWDNLHPEFDFGVNIGRSIFAVWQEYQGTGLLGGMAHASDLLRQIFLLFLSLFLPMNSLRYVWTFLMLFVGSVGSYFLIKHVLDFRTLGKLGKPESQTAQAIRQSDKPSSEYSEFSGQNNLIPFLGACFYLLNLATIQMFAVPFEAFIGFFGFLPWLILASVNYYQKPSRKSLFFLIITLLLSTPAWYIQTLFIVFIISLSILVSAFILKTPKKNALLKAAKLYGVIFIVNSFWLLPVVYFTITNSQVNLNSKINQMATGIIFSQNKEFGTLPDVMQLKGFMLNGVDPKAQGTTGYLLKPWRDHLGNPFVSLAGYLLFVPVFIGFIKTIKAKSPILKGFAFLFIFVFFALAIDTFPISVVNSILRESVPIVNQIFRFPFTKFSTLASLIFAVLFALGIQSIDLRLKIKDLRINHRRITFLLLTSYFLLLTFFTLPVFRGQLFYEKERAKIPKEYFQLFDFFRSQDPNTRIANFPQNTFWGWSFYNWPENEYGGSGFIWYGIKQPVLDRAFDVWSSYSENYYFEVTQAVYSKNAVLLEKVLNKYQIGWVLIDKNIYDPTSSKARFFTELEELLDTGSYARKAETFGKIDIYKINLTQKPKNFVFAASSLPVVNKYNWNNYDQAYFENGNYISTNPRDTFDTRGTLDTQSLYYPFHSLFSQKTQKEIEYHVQENKDSIEFKADIPASSRKTRLVIPSFLDKEKVIPVKLVSEKTNTGPKIIAKALLPEVIVDDKNLTPNSAPSFQIPVSQIIGNQYPLKININGAGSFDLTNENKEIGVTFFNFKSKNVMTLSNKNRQPLTEVTFAPEIFQNLSTAEQLVLLPENKKGQKLSIKFPKINDKYLSFVPNIRDVEKSRNCDKFRKDSFSTRFEGSDLIFSARNASSCVSYYSPNLPHSQAYLIFIKSKHIAGQGLRLWVENVNEQYGPIDTYLSKDLSPVTSSFIVPPQELFGTAYAVHFDNLSIGHELTINQLSSVKVYPIFYNYLKAVKLQTGENKQSTAVDVSSLNVDHPNESLYIIEVSGLRPQSSNPTTLILSQAYDQGWKAYAISNNNWLKTAFPFIFGKEIKQHVMVNNWENGWILDDSAIKQSNNEVIVLVYLPQYLEYLGFLLLFVPIILIIASKKGRRVVDIRDDI